MQRDLWKRFNQFLVVPIVGVGVLYVALEPSTPAVDTEVASAVQDAAVDIDAAAVRDTDPTTAPHAGGSVASSAPVGTPAPVPSAGVGATTSASTTSTTTTAVSAPSTPASPTTSTTSTTVPASTAVPAPPDAVTTVPTSTTVPAADPGCLVQLPLPLGKGWLCVVPGVGALIG